MSAACHTPTPPSVSRANKCCPYIIIIIISGPYAYLRRCPEYALALAPQEDPTQTDPPGSHAVRVAFHKMEECVGLCAVERCYPRRYF